MSVVIHEDISPVTQIWSDGGYDPKVRHGSGAAIILTANRHRYPTSYGNRHPIGAM
jgi:hypothetical protein